MLLAALTLLAACRSDDPAPETGAAGAPETGTPAPGARPAAGADTPAPTVQPLSGGARPSLLLAQAWFSFDAGGQPHTAPARLDIWRPGSDGRWAYTRLEDGDSNVFHKALPLGDGFLTLGADRALLKRWRFDRQWRSETIWEGSWGGRFNRLRDAELGDLDGDGTPEVVIATHDHGVVAVVSLDGRAEELGGAPDTFVHEIELGDLDGDGALEIICTPSARNQESYSQAGEVRVYRRRGGAWAATAVDARSDTHAKEVLAADLDGDGRAAIYALFEAAVDAGGAVRHPVTLRRYTAEGDGFSAETLLTLPARQARFLVSGDFDGDGTPELVASTRRAGLFHITRGAAGWSAAPIATDSSGFEHALLAQDLDGDGAVELYVAADDQRQLRRYTLDSGRWTAEVLGVLPGEARAALTWNITAMTL